MRVQTTPTALPGCLVIQPPCPSDARGRFAKPWTSADFAALGIAFTPAECYHSTSHRGVVRGLHCQFPPHGHGKLVTCVAGRAFDVALDVRRSSPTFGQHHALTLDAGLGNALWIPEGCAHGFQALDDGCVLLYLVGSAHAPAADGGVRFDSCGIAWPLPVSAVSPRDAALPALIDLAPMWT